MSHNSAYLQLIPHGVYYYRIAKTKPLRLCFGKRELKKLLEFQIERKRSLMRWPCLSQQANYFKGLTLWMQTTVMAVGRSDKQKPPWENLTLKKRSKTRGG